MKIRFNNPEINCYRYQKSNCCDFFELKINNITEFKSSDFLTATNSLFKG